MKRIIISGIFIVMLVGVANSQQRIAAGNAMLRLTGMTEDGEEATANSQALSIMYDIGQARGELSLGFVNSPDPGINALLQSMADKTIRFTFEIPEGKFAFGDSMNEKFDTPGKIMLDDLTSEITVHLEVSNLKNGKENAFVVVGSGRLSFRTNFNVTDQEELDDSFTFVFTQNLNLFSP